MQLNMQYILNGSHTHTYTHVISCRQGYLVEIKAFVYHSPLLYCLPACSFFSAALTPHNPQTHKTKTFRSKHERSL